MSLLTRIAKGIALTVLLASTFISCGNQRYSFVQDLSNSIYYCESPQSYTLKDLLKSDPAFKKLEKEQKSHLSKLISTEENSLWLKIDFEVMPALENQPIGLIIPHLRAADMLYLNGNMIRKYGDLPPNENSSGFLAHYYMFPPDLIHDGNNTIYFKVWPGPVGSISNTCYLSDQAHIFRRAELISFFNSKIVITFTSVSLLIAIIYSILYFILRKYKENRMYIIYALLNLYTAHFLLAFCFAEITFLKIPWVSYLSMMKFTYCYGGFSTVYFANSFIITYLGYEVSYKEMNTRIGMLAANVLIAVLIPSYTLFAKMLPFLVIFALLQFCFSIPRIFQCLRTPEKKETIHQMLRSFSPVLITLPIDAFIKLVLKKEDFPYLTLYGWQATIYVFLWDLLRKFGNLYIHNTKLKTQLEEFNSNLEEVVALRTKELSETNYVLSRGLETVAHVQRNFLPPQNKTFRGWDLSIYYRPLDNNVSGDLYDYYVTNNDLYGLGIFDISGHGIPAGLMTILSKGIISQHFLTGLEQDESISDVLEEINKTYIREKVNVENYITGLLFRFSEFNKNDICSVEFANAGHPYPLLYSAEKNTVAELKYEDPDKQYGIIGIEGLDVSFPPVSLRMGKDDIILCFTDGLTETMNSNRDEFSKERVIEILQENHSLSASEIVDKIIEHLQVFAGNYPLNDDITVIVLKRTDSSDFLEEI